MWLMLCVPGLVVVTDRNRRSQQKKTGCVKEWCDNVAVRIVAVNEFILYIQIAAPFSLPVLLLYPTD